MRPDTPDDAAYFGYYDLEQRLWNARESVESDVIVIGVIHCIILLILYYICIIICIFVDGRL